jgi:outer membrane immunogenic protein
MEGRHEEASGCYRCSRRAGRHTGTAADMAAPVYKAPPPPAPIFSWTGFYVGGNAGAEWTRSNFTSFLDPTGGFFTAASYAFINSMGNGSAHRTGFIGGGQAGYNWQTGNFVIGLEGDIDWLSASATFNTAGLTPGGSNVTMSNSLAPRWLATVRPRVGVAVNQLLLYATGGLAVLNSTYTQTFTNVTGGTPGGGGSNTNTTKAGWVVGGGAEYAFTHNWSVKAEYLYSKFSGVSTAGFVVPGPGFTPIALTGTPSQSIQIARAGLNYHF